MTQRHDFIALATLAGANGSELCRRFGVMALVQAHLESLFRTHGLPAAILCDHGSP